jgi:hypothetical protein
LPTALSLKTSPVKFRNYLYPSFAERALERRFIHDNNEKAARQARWGFAFGTFGYAVLGVIAYLIQPEMFMRTWPFIYGFIFRRISWQQL